MNQPLLYIFRPYLNCFDHDDSFLIEAVKADLLSLQNKEVTNLDKIFLRFLKAVNLNLALKVNLNLKPNLT